MATHIKQKYQGAKRKPTKEFGKQVPHEVSSFSMSLSRDGDHVNQPLAQILALLLAILTGRSDLCIAGVFGAGKTRSLAVLLIALSCELDDFYAIVYTKENVAAKALADQISDLSPPTQSTFGQLSVAILAQAPLGSNSW